jgi:competence protein ComEA
MIFRQIREYFLFTRRERNGLLVLVFILLATVCIDYLIPHMVPEQVSDVSELKAEAEKYYAGNTSGNELNGNPVKGIFDPNHITREDLIKLGVPPGLAGNWIKYLQKGGKFYRKEDISKLYGMTDDLYEKLKVRLVVPLQAGPPGIKTGNSPSNAKVLTVSGRKDTMMNSVRLIKREVVMVEINKADSAQLESLPGIGPVLASRILKYRNLIGGFYSVSQLRDIYGMTEELWQKSSRGMCVDSLTVKKLEVNFLSLSELGRHPYIGFRTARKIVNKRDSSGKFNKKEELNAIFSADSLRRILPYIAIADTKF